MVAAQVAVVGDNSVSLKNESKLNSLAGKHEGQKLSQAQQRDVDNFPLVG